METKKTKKPSMAGRVLARWLSQNKLSVRKLAVQLDVDQSNIYCWSDGRTVPSLKNAVRLEEITGIPVMTWVQNDEAGGPSEVIHDGT